jgi:hypothetical protein
LARTNLKSIFQKTPQEKLEKTPFSGLYNRLDNFFAPRAFGNFANCNYNFSLCSVGNFFIDKSLERKEQNRKLNLEFERLMTSFIEVFLLQIFLDQQTQSPFEAQRFYNF